MDKKVKDILNQQRKLMVLDYHIFNLDEDIRYILYFHGKVMYFHLKIFLKWSQILFAREIFQHFYKDYLRKYQTDIF